MTRWVIHKTINEQKKILYYIHLYSVILYYILLYYYIILYYINITLYYIDISKKINKSWESFGWHVRASMDAHFPIALLCLYTLNVAGSPSYWKSQKKTPLKQFTWQKCRNVNGDIYKIDAADCKHCGLAHKSETSALCCHCAAKSAVLLPLLPWTVLGCRRVYKFQTIEIDRQRANGGTNWTEFAWWNLHAIETVLHASGNHSCGQLALRISQIPTFFWKIDIR